MGESAREAARRLFYDREAVSEKGVKSELEKVGEAENVGIASASKVFSDCCSDNQEDLKGKMESLGGRVAKEEYSRLVAEVEEKKKKEESEHRFKAMVEEAARFAARGVFSMMTSEEREASGDKIVEEEIVLAGEEAALAEFDEFVRIEEMNSEEKIEKTVAEEESERLEVALLGKEAALAEYKRLREELEEKIRESRQKAEEEAEAARRLEEG